MNPEQIEALVALPYSTLGLLAAGYLGYRLAYTGKDGTHTTIDVIFLSLVFAFVARVASQFADPVFETGMPPVLFGVAAALVGAAIWRRWGERAIAHTLRISRISTSDRHPTAWATILADDTKKLSTLVVRKTSGKSFMSEGLEHFRKLKFGPCILGADGSIALFATHFRFNPEDDWQELQPIDSDWGASLIVIPASEISEVEIRCV